MRTSMPPDTVGASIRSALLPVLPNLPANQVETMRRLVDKTVSPRRFVTMLLGGFAAFAVTLVTMLLTVVAVAVVGGYLPARRASRIDPATAFRAS